MQKYVCRQWRRWVASLLIVTLFCGCLSIEGLAAEPVGDQTVDTEETTEEQGITLEEVQETEADVSYEVTKEDVIEELSTEDSTTYDIGNGVHMAEFYAQKVRFREEGGALVDYDPSLVEITADTSLLGNSLEDYAYENQAGDRKQYFPELLSEETPILLEQGEYQIRVSPILDKKTAVEEESLVASEEVQAIAEENMELVEVSEEPELQPAILQEAETMTIYEEEVIRPLQMLYPEQEGKMGYQYTSLDNGVKEELIFYEIPEVTEYSFRLEIPGLTIRENGIDEGFTIYDDEKIVAGIQAPFMNDATGEVRCYSKIVTLNWIEMI